MSDLSSAIWDKLPPINEQTNKTECFTVIKEKIRKKDYELLVPQTNHLRVARLKNAVHIMDNLITKILLADKFQTIMNNEKVMFKMHRYICKNL